MEVVLTENQSLKIKEQITNLINEVIKARMNTINPEKRYFTRTELQKYLSIGASSMEQLQGLGLHYVKVGNRHLFDIQEVYDIFENHKVR